MDPLWKGNPPATKAQEPGLDRRQAWIDLLEPFIGEHRAIHQLAEKIFHPRMADRMNPPGGEILDGLGAVSHLEEGGCGEGVPIAADHLPAALFDQV